MKLCVVLLEPVGRASLLGSKTTLVGKMQIVWKGFIVSEVFAAKAPETWPESQLAASTGAIISLRGNPNNCPCTSKQHLRIKAFFGTSENAVKTQIWIAVSVYVLVAILKKRLHLEHLSLYTILQILSVSLFEKKLISQALSPNNCKNLHGAPDNQLDLFSY